MYTRGWRAEKAGEEGKVYKWQGMVVVRGQGALPIASCPLTTTFLLWKPFLTCLLVVVVGLQGALGVKTRLVFGTSHYKCCSTCLALVQT